MNEKYNLVDTIDKLKMLDKILMENDKPKFSVLAYDTETNGLELHKTVVVGFSVSFDAHRGYYVPILVWVPDKDSLKQKTIKKVKYSIYEHGHFYCPWNGKTYQESVTPKEFDLRKEFPLIPALVQRWFQATNLYMWNAPFDVNQTVINMGVDLKNNLFIDGSLLVHILDENEPTALKKAIERYRAALGINPHALAAQEKKELDNSIIINGGKSGNVWRANLDVQSKYACADTFMTYGTTEAAMADFVKRFGPDMAKWLLETEVMPVCKEVVCDMKLRGVFVDVPHFHKLNQENSKKMEELNDYIIKTLEANKLLDGFNIGKSVDDEISNQALVKKIIELEGLKIPTTVNKKTGEEKESIAKGVVKKEYEKNPHWIWAYILGEDEIKYSDEKLSEIKLEMYREKIGRKHRFNINSQLHLRWLFCEKLGHSATDLPQTDAATKENPIPSMKAEVLREFFLDKYSWVKDILLWRKIEKLQSSYILPALTLNIGGWLYMDMRQNGTTSGRFSCSGGFNLQTLPRADDENEALESCEKCHSNNVVVDQYLESVAKVACQDCHHEYDVPCASAIKKGFIAPPGYKIVNADYSSLEPRCFAVMSGEESIKDVYRKGLDLYSQVYCDIFDVNKEFSADPKAPNFLKKVDPPKRKWIKPIVLGIPYGSGDSQVANMINAKKSIIDKETGKVIEIPDVSEGRRVREAYLGKYQKLSQYMDDQDFKAVSLGYVETLIGRRRHLKYAKNINDVLMEYGVDYRDLKDASRSWLTKKECSYKSKRTGLEVRLTEEMMRKIQDKLDIDRQTYAEKGYWAYIRALLKADLNNAKNNPIQGLAGHTTNVAMLEANRAFKSNGIDGWVCLQVHDELTCYIKEEQAELGSNLLKVSMENNLVTQKLDIPMIAEPIIASNLKEAK